MLDLSSLEPGLQAPGEEGEIYLDYQASTPCDPQVVEAMVPYLVRQFANPASNHRAGARVERAIELAREHVAAAIGALPGEIVFTSGATESNNLAVFGAATGAGSKRSRIVATAVEHASVLSPCEHLTQRGFELATCPVHRDGRLDLDALEDLIDEKTLLVSIQAANNELGTVQPLDAAAHLARRTGAVLHVDAAQGLGKLPIDVDTSPADLMSLSAHKAYGPKGTGALFIRGGARSGLVEPLWAGGGQESGLRSGTQNVAGIVGFGKAAEIAASERTRETVRLAALRDALERDLLNTIPGLKRNGAIQSRLAGVSSFTLPGVPADAVLANAPQLSISTSSACSSGGDKVSHVLKAIGLSEAECRSSFRVSVGRFTTRSEIVTAGKALAHAVARVRSCSGMGDST